MILIVTFLVFVGVTALLFAVLDAATRIVIGWSRVDSE